ncbi:MAG: rRNA methyltransferase, partial [Chloroflexota bacterium]|nr:rRNA methyltransferase [Chloroflexota bacterium]
AYRRQSPRAAAPALLAAARPDAPVAVVLGREDSGLPNEALDLAHLLLTIPTVADNRSLNLAQAALVIAYELWLAAQEPVVAVPAAPAAAPPALGRDAVAMAAALESLLAAQVPASRLAYDLALLRALLLRAQPNAAEAARLAHLFRRLARQP